MVLASSIHEHVSPPPDELGESRTSLDDFLGPEPDELLPMVPKSDGQLNAMAGPSFPAECLQKQAKSDDLIQPETTAIVSTASEVFLFGNRVGGSGKFRTWISKPLLQSPKLQCPIARGNLIDLESGGISTPFLHQSDLEFGQTRSRGGPSNRR